VDWLVGPSVSTLAE